MIDEVDTNSDFSDKIIPDGKHHFKVLGTRKVKENYAWSLAYEDGAEGEILLFKNMMGPLLKALGCKESEPGKYILNTDVIDGAEFDAEIYTEKTYKRIKNIVGSDVPY